MSQVFISYSRRDISFVERLVQDLKRTGMAVWYDLSGLEGGARWGEKIQQAIRQSDYVIVVLSPDSVQSEWVEREFLFASNEKKKIIPLLYRQCEMPFNYLNLNYIDVQGENYNQNFEKIVRGLNADMPTMMSITKKPAPAKKTSYAGKPEKSTGKTVLTVLGVLFVCGLFVCVASVFLYPTISPMLKGILPSNMNVSIGSGGGVTITPGDPVVQPGVTISPTPTFTPTYTPTPTFTPTVQINFCDQLVQNSFDIRAENGFTGVIGPSGILLIANGNGNYTFTTVAAFPNEQLDAVSGNCKGNTLTFTRTRPKSFIQDYQAELSQNSSGILSLDGLLTDRATGQKVKWSGQVTEALTPNGLCDQLAGKSININQVNGFQGIVGSDGVSLIARGDGSYIFTTVAVYRNEQADPVTGSCQENTLTFTRTRTNAFTQDFKSTISQKSGGILSLDGSVTDRASGESVMWTGQIIAP